MIQKEQRLLWPDFMKGIAIFMVAIGHSVMIGDAVKSWVYTLHLPAFFFVSGYFLHLKEENAWKTIKGKMCALLPLYLLLSLLGFAAESILAGDVKWNRLLGICICVQGGSYDGYLWFFPALLGLECILIILMKVTKKAPLIWISCIVLAAFALAARQFGLPRLFWHLDSAFLLAPFAGLGMLTKQYAEKKEPCCVSRAGKWAVIAGLLAVNILLCVCNRMGAEGHIDYNVLVTNNPLTCYGAGITGVLWLMLFCKELPEMKWLTFVGKNSAVYYCFNWVGSRLSLSVLPVVPMTMLAMLALWAVPIPFVLILNRWFPWIVGRRKASETLLEGL